MNQKVFFPNLMILSFSFLDSGNSFQSAKLHVLPCSKIIGKIERSSIQFLPQEVFTDVASGEKKEIDFLAQVCYQQQDTCFLIHIENQSYTETAFAKRMFKYFARLHEKYDLPIYPVVIFSFDEPLRPEPQNYRITFPDLNVLEFQFAAIQLNRLSWRDFLTQPNPVTAALMSKMNIKSEERPQVKAELTFHEMWKGEIGSRMPYANHCDFLYLAVSSTKSFKP